MSEVVGRCSGRESVVAALVGEQKLSMTLRPVLAVWTVVVHAAPVAAGAADHEGTSSDPQARSSHSEQHTNSCRFVGE